jgi:hypothetical protein
MTLAINTKEETVIFAVPKRGDWKIDKTLGSVIRIRTWLE